MNKHTFIFAKITPKPEYFEVSKEAIIEIISQTRNESGCLEFTLHEDGAGSLYLYEEWIDDNALKLHHEMGYTKAVFEAYTDWLATPPEISKLIKLA
ncbi:putative quinol monooxygenase [Aliivibrio kagoshimensis]|uniref:putative quinol monooxygenase n=1 Tax=Aliivibrio kagoshimensis TaxID=2910230 RepID=UPI003D115589